MHTNKTITWFVLALLAMTVYSHVNNGHHNCAHGRFTDEPELLDVNEEFLPRNSRLLQTGSYPRIRIEVDYSLLNGTTEFKNYIKTDLLPPVIDYFEAAIAVKQPLTSNLRLSTTTKTICSGTTPSALYTGVATDLYIIVSATEDTDNWVASAGACMLSSATKRPIIAQMLFNTVFTKAAAGDVLVHERNMYLTMHEMMHALGFTGSSFKYFIDDYGQPLQGHIKTILLNGYNRTVLDVEPLTTKLRTHFGCSRLEGAYMENDGGAGTAGSHFERRYFSYEVMTSGVIDGRRVSELSLSLLEGSGWYMPNYTYAEPFFYGQGTGCNFFYPSCDDIKTDFDDFCSGSSRQCTGVGRGGGACVSDSRSDGCTYVLPTLDYDCENPDAVDNARLPTREAFGRTAGSKCFEGNLTTLTTKTTQTSFCFKHACSGTGLTTTVNVTVGTTTVTCKAEGYIKVSGLNGNLYCPDPVTFCNTAGKKFCPRNCMGRGKCVSNKCVCNSGYTGVDCALSTTSIFA